MLKRLPFRVQSMECHTTSRPGLKSHEEPLTARLSLHGVIDLSLPSVIRLVLKRA